MRQRVIENLWACDTCRASNRGRTLLCRNCGKRRYPSVQDIVPEPSTAPTVTEPSLLQEALAGPHWSCPYCSCSERDTTGECTNCGGLRSVPAPVRRVLEKQEAARKRKTQELAAPSFLVRPLLGGLKVWQCGVLTLLSGLLILGIFWLFSARQVDAVVTKTAWQYTEHLREREVRQDSGWGHPGGKGFYNEAAFGVSCDSRYYGTEDCHPHNCRAHSQSYSCHEHSCRCHETCRKNGNGFSTCNTSCGTCSDTCYRTVYDTCYDRCPVYKDWCSYSYNEWPVKDTRITQGAGRDTTWPGLQPSGSGQRVQKLEDYTVSFKADDEDLHYKPDTLADYRRFVVGDTWKLKIGHVTGRVAPVRIVRSNLAEASP